MGYRCPQEVLVIWWFCCCGYSCFLHFSQHFIIIGSLLQKASTIMLWIFTQVGTFDLTIFLA